MQSSISHEDIFDTELLTAFLAVLIVIIAAELVRQTWRANRCQALARRRAVEKSALSQDHAIAEPAFERLHALSRRETGMVWLGRILRWLSLVGVIAWIMVSILGGI